MPTAFDSRQALQNEPDYDALSNARLAAISLAGASHEYPLLASA